MICLALDNGAPLILESLRIDRCMLAVGTLGLVLPLRGSQLSSDATALCISSQRRDAVKTVNGLVGMKFIAIGREDSGIEF